MSIKQSLLGLELFNYCSAEVMPPKLLKTILYLSIYGHRKIMSITNACADEVDTHYNWWFQLWTDKYLKTRKLREAEESAQRQRITKVLFFSIHFCLPPLFSCVVSLDMCGFFYILKLMTRVVFDNFTNMTLSFCWVYSHAGSNKDTVSWQSYIRGHIWSDRKNSKLGWSSCQSDC